MRASFPILAALATVTIVMAVRPASAESDDAICQRWGSMPGTQAYFNCRATLERDRPGAVQPVPVLKPEVIGDGLALTLCDTQARSASRYPILNRATTRVSGEHEKRVSISYKIAKPGTSLAFMNVECLLHGRRFMNITMNQ